MLSKKEMSAYLLSNLVVFTDLPMNQIEQSIFRDIDSVKELTRQGCFTLGMLIVRMQSCNFGDKDVLEQIKIAILLELSEEK